MELLSRPEVPDGGKPGSSSVRDEVVVGLDDFGGEQNWDDSGDLLNGDFRRQVDPSVVQGLLDRPEEGGRRVVQA